MEHRDSRVSWAFRALTAHKELKVLPGHRDLKAQETFLSVNTGQIRWQEAKIQ